MARIKKNTRSQDGQLSQDEFEAVLAEIEQFDHNSFSYLADSEDYEIIPMTLEDGTVLGTKEINMLKREVHKLGSTILYRVDHPNGETLLLSARHDTVKVMLLKEGMQ